MGLGQYPQLHLNWYLALHLPCGLSVFGGFSGLCSLEDSVNYSLTMMNNCPLVGTLFQGAVLQ